MQACKTDVKPYMMMMKDDDEATFVYCKKSVPIIGQNRLFDFGL